MSSQHRPFYGLRFAALVCFLSLQAAACGDDEPNKAVADVADTTGDTEVADPDVVANGPTVRFDLAAARGGDFYAFPFPNDLRATADGGPDLGGFPDHGVADLQALLDEVGTHVRGFSPNGAIFFEFEAALDYASLPQEPADTLADEASLFIINLEPASPDYGRRVVTTAHFHPDARAYNPANLLVVRPAYGFPMRGGERYAAVLMRTLRLGGGDLVGPQPTWDAIRGSVLPPAGVDPELHSQVRGLLADLEEAGVDPDQVLVATPFTTSDPASELDALRTAVEALPFPIAKDLAIVDQTEERIVFQGTFPLVNYQQGTPPYTDSGQGHITFDGNGAPIAAATLEARFVLVTPGVTEVPYFPLVVYAHGAGGDAESVLAEEGPAMAVAGVAMIAVDGPLSGARNPTTRDSAELHLELATHNLIAYRDLVRQFVADQLQLMRMIELLQIETALSPWGVSIDLRTNPLVLMGHSFGAQTVALLLGVEPRIDSAVLSEAGGGAALAFVQRKSGGVDLQAELGTMLQLESGEVLDENHPVVALVLQPILDPIDPLNVARRWVYEPIGTPRDVLMTLGSKDVETVPDSIVSLAAAAGVPPVTPLATPSPLWTLAGLAPVNAPVQANVNVVAATNCERTPCTVTSGLISYPLGHDLIYTSPDARNRYMNFLVSALNGNPMIVVSN